MVKFLLDTNVISGFISAKYSEETMQLVGNEIDSGAKLSIITQIELLSWKTDASVENLLKEFIFSSDIFSLTEEIAYRCVQLRRKYKIKTPDAIIAATALHHGLTIVSENEKDFANIKGLKILKPI